MPVQIISQCSKIKHRKEETVWSGGVFCYRNPAETFPYSNQFKLFFPAVTFLITAQYKSITAQFFLCSSWNKVNISVLLNSHLFLFSLFSSLIFLLLISGDARSQHSGSHISNWYLNFYCMFAQYLWSFQSLIQSATLSGKNPLNHERKA